jgi:hypothetical protein
MACNRAPSATLAGRAASALPRDLYRGRQLRPGRDEVAPGAPTLRTLLPIALTAILLVGCGGDHDATPSSTARTSPPNGPTGPTGAGGATSTTPSPSPSKSKPRPPSDSDSSSNSNAQPPPQQGSTPTPTPVGSVPSGSGSTADRKAVIRTVRTYLLSIAHGDGEQACAQLTPGGRRRVMRKLAEFAPETTGAPCAGVILLYQSTYRDQHPRITDVRVRGHRARAVGPIHQVASLVKQGSLWLIAAYGQ